MGHVLFAAPPTHRLHLHERLGRRLLSRGHRVTVLASDPFTAALYAAQTMAVREIRPATPMTSHAPLQEFALIDRIAAGDASPGHYRLHRDERRLSRSLRALVLLLETDRPDVVVFHQGRSGLHRLLHFLARDAGVPVLHTGDGLLPGTMQWDGEGIDGGASVCRRSAYDYRGEKRDVEFLRAALSSWVSHGCPAPLPRHPVTRPGLRLHLDCLGRSLAQRDWPSLRRTLAGSRRAVPIPTVPMPVAVPLPERPFVAVLLQRGDSQRLRLDAAPHANSRDLALATLAAAQAVDRELAVVAVLPRRGLDAGDAVRLQRPGLQIVPAGAVSATLVTALAVTTVNHPLGIGALLAGTPVLHTGNTPYAVRDVARRTSIETLRADLPSALKGDRPLLRERFLSRYLRVDSLWCSADFPDHNGLEGLVAGIEDRMQQRPAVGGEPVYRAGPAWPLHAEA